MIIDRWVQCCRLQWYHKWSTKYRTHTHTHTYKHPYTHSSLTLMRSVPLTWFDFSGDRPEILEVWMHINFSDPLCSYTVSRKLGSLTFTNNHGQPCMGQKTTAVCVHIPAQPLTPIKHSTLTHLVGFLHFKVLEET
jgi:hypothetical protein